MGFLPDGWGRILLRQITALNAHAYLTCQFANSGVTKFMSCTRSYLKLSTTITYDQHPTRRAPTLWASTSETQVYLHGLYCSLTVQVGIWLTANLMCLRSRVKASWDIRLNEGMGCLGQLCRRALCPRVYCSLLRAVQHMMCPRLNAPCWGLSSGTVALRLWEGPQSSIHRR